MGSKKTTKNDSLNSIQFMIALSIIFSYTQSARRTITMSNIKYLAYKITTNLAYLLNR